MWSFGAHTNNIWRGNLSFIQGFDNLLDLICGSVLHASRSTMTWSVNRQFTIYMSLVWEIWQSNRLFHCQWVLKSRKELQSMLGLSKPLHETSKIYDELHDKSSDWADEWISRSWRLNFYAATDNMHASQNYEKGFFSICSALESGSTVGLEEERWSLEARADWKNAGTSS